MIHPSNVTGPCVDPRVVELSLENARLLLLAVAQDEYIALLCQEIDMLMPLASTHGWKSTRYEAGVAAREKIAKYRA